MILPFISPLLREDARNLPEDYGQEKRFRLLANSLRKQSGSVIDGKAWQAGAGLMKRCFSRVLFCCALCGVGELFVGGLTLRG